MPNQFLYTDFYERLLHITNRGLKLVPGGTGLGKTRGIREVIAQDQTNRKYIYVANRVQLLDEMEAGFRDDQVAYVHQRRDRELVQRLLTQPQDRRDFYQLLDSALVRSLCATVKTRYRRRLDPVRMRQICDELLHVPSTRNDMWEEIVNGRVRQLIDFWRTLIRVAGDNGKGQPAADWFKLVNNPLLQRLFPYMHYKHDPTVKVLLVTIQKLYHGFFDGQRQVDILSLMNEDGGRVIFLDEFDFLETNLTDLLCEDTTIRAPFHFVEQFYRTMSRDKLPLADYPVDRASVREQIEAIIEEIDDIKATLPFPNLVQFTYHPKPDSIRPTLFQTSRTILTEPLFLEPTERAWHIVAKEHRTTEDALEALSLFHTVHRMTYQILQLFKSLEVNDPVAYRELLEHCFAHTVFYDELARVQQMAPPRPGQATGFDSLLAAGYGLYELRDLRHDTDPDQVDWRYFSLYTTPEAILATLAEHNLVFGLSATALLPRYLGGFNLEWIAAQPGVQVHVLDTDDYALIAQLNERKQESRANRLTSLRAELLDQTDTFQRKIYEFIAAISKESGFGKDDPKHYRRQRVEHFFRTLLWIAGQPEATGASSTHLLFFNSYRQIEYLFQSHPLTEDRPSLWTIRPLEGSDARHPVFRYYEIEFAGTAFVVIFYNAARAQQIERDEASQAHFNEAFWDDKPVVVVTTYPSAGNGVNLQYLPARHSTPRDTTDFHAIHLLDSPFYYFASLSEEQTPAERHATLKKNIWYLAKLSEAKLIGAERFRRLLGTLRQAGLNNLYHREPGTAMDALLNRLATFIQALGRIERVWHPLPDQTVRMSREVWETFAAFATQSAYETFRADVLPALSNNMRQVMDQVVDQVGGMTRQQNRYQDERLPDWNQQSQDAVGTLLRTLWTLHGETADPTARAEWEQLRRVVLRHDFQDPLVTRYRSSFETGYVEAAVLYFTPERFLVPKHIWNGTFRPWHLNQCYAVVAHNDITRQHFEQRGYELAFRSSSRHVFTPYCYQAILVGAIGEEGIKAVLRREGIGLAPLPDHLYEVTDLKVDTRPWYIDCKNYTDSTLEAFPLPQTDPAYRPALNDDLFKSKARSKLQTLQHQYARPKDVKLIYLNLASTDEWVAQYYDSNFAPVRHFADAAIVVIPGVLQREAPSLYTKAFQQVLPFLQQVNVEEVTL